MESMKRKGILAGRPAMHAPGERARFTRKSIRTVGLYAALILVALLFLFPLYWVAVTSLKTEGDVMRMPPEFFPAVLHWENYAELMSRFDFGIYAFNSFKVSILGVIGALISCSMAAFVFARMDFPGKNVLFALLMSTMMIPSQVTLIPQFLIFTRLGLMNTHLALFLPDYLARAFGVFLLRQYFLTIPKELEDAARIDGCGTFRIYGRIYLPLAKPALATLAIFTFMDDWNDLVRPVVYLNDNAKRTITVGMALLESPTATTWVLMMCGAIVSIIPLLIVYIFAQQYFVRGIATSGLKG